MRQRYLNGEIGQYYFPFVICHFSFVIVGLGHKREIPVQMTNEKWQMTNGKCIDFL
jgi:hypothetical protein